MDRKVRNALGNVATDIADRTNASRGDFMQIARKHVEGSDRPISGYLDPIAKDIANDRRFDIDAQQVEAIWKKYAVLCENRFQNDGSVSVDANIETDNDTNVRGDF